ncbi:lipoprotein [Cystobacter fuscus]|uniref:Lipoprotein n=1 Tax=Cystobacter fuscus TaxID=43 RepID=A0A250J8E9_9BACT|nr:hypothetical protein [Cystobacter fuscus]ATB40174.1 lipoprotein [Cystobacter fuscus]
MKRIRLSILGLGAAMATGCTIEAPDFTGKSCTAAADCPAPLTCVAARPGEGRTCELLRGPGIAEPPGGPVPTWCNDIQPVMVAGCVAGCHGVSGIGPKGFRLDVYEGDGGVLGARDMAARIKARAVTERNMPPLGSTEFSEEQRALLDRWVTGGAPLCGDEGTADGGTPDGGSRDGGA